MLSQKKSILARLLSNENIDVRHGNFETAAFDVVNRVLFLPLWENISSELYDLLTGHEVGHALYTPADGWHESDKKFDFPRAFINIIEDIRIERLIQDRYPGLRRSFVSGYKELNEKDFFGLSERSVDSLSFMDRLNVKAKLRTLVDVDFTAEEKQYFDLAYTPETFDDVLSVCQKIYEWLNEKEAECNPPASAETSSDQDNTFQEGMSTMAPEGLQDSDEETDMTQGFSSPSNQQNQQPSDSQEDGLSNDTTSTEESQGDDAGTDAAGQQPDVDEMETFTDDTFRRRETELVEKDHYGNTYEVSYGIEGYNLDDLIVDYKPVMESRRKSLDSLENSDYSYWLSDTENSYHQFISQADKFTNLVAREFEMRKRASQLMRAKEAKTGKLDMSKLPMYKFTDNMFLSNTEIPDAKSHGIVAIIDFSGSMGSVLQNVIDQAITLAMFCRKANIPFDIYSFTTKGRIDSLDHPKTQGLNQANLDNTWIIHQLSSKMKKPEFNEAVRLMYNSSILRRFSDAEYDFLGGTPLDGTLLVMNKLLDRFKAVNRLEKVTFMTITDGDSHAVDFTETGSWNTTKVKVDNEYISTSRYGTATSKILSHIRSKGYNTVGYFICDSNRDLRYQTKYYIAQFEEAAKEKIKYYRKNGFTPMEKEGYDSFFILNGRIDAIDDDFEVKDSAKTNEIKTAFKKYANSKKSKRVFATHFAEAVA